MTDLNARIRNGLLLCVVVVSAWALGPNQVCEEVGIPVAKDCGSAPACAGTCSRNWNDCHTCNSGYGTCSAPRPGTACTTRRETTSCIPLVCWCWPLGWTTVPGTTLLLPETCL